MRRLGLLILLTACDLQPAKQQKSTGSATAVAPPVAPAPPEPVDAGVKVAPIKASEACIEVATHLSKLVIGALTDDNARAAQQQDEARMIKSVAETCNKDKWTDEGRKCLLASKALKDTEACNVKPPTE